MKNELIDTLYEEFSLGGKKLKVKEYLSRFRKESIKEAAEALRRKLVVAELAPQNRWWYLSKVVYNIEKKKKEVQLLKAQQTIRQEKQKDKDEEERKKIEQEKHWYKAHPEQALEKTIEWYLALSHYEIGRDYYQREIIRLTESVLNNHSLTTAGMKVARICKRIKKKETTTNMLKNKIELNSKVPTLFEIEKAKEKIITLIKQHNFREKQNMLTIQNLKRMWIK